MYKPVILLKKKKITKFQIREILKKKDLILSKLATSNHIRSQALIQTNLWADDLLARCSVLLSKPLHASPQGCLSGGLPARLVRSIDLCAHPIRVKRALIDPHGKSDLPYPCWLPLGPPHRRVGGRRRIAKRGRNGKYGMSGADPVGNNGMAGTDGKDGRERTSMAQTDMGARMAVADTRMWARTFRAGIGMWVQTLRQV